jgi:hypothetical protein
MDRFWSKVDKSLGGNGCWPWTASTVAQGYGRFRTPEKTLRAHRVALQLSGTFVGPADVVMHMCDNPRCCNPAHLRVGTHRENTDDMMAKGRFRARGKTSKAALKGGCAKGHPFTPENTSMEGGARRCLACRRDRARRSYHRRAPFMREAIRAANRASYWRTRKRATASET